MQVDLSFLRADLIVVLHIRHCVDWGFIVEKREARLALHRRMLGPESRLGVRA